MYIIEPDGSLVGSDLLGSWITLYPYDTFYVFSPETKTIYFYTIDSQGDIEQTSVYK